MDRDSQYYLDVLHELIDIGAGMARQVHQEAIAQAKKGALTSEFAGRFETIARSVRQSIMLAEKIAEDGQHRPARNRAAPSAEDPTCLKLSEYRATLLRTIPRIRDQ